MSSKAYQNVCGGINLKTIHFQPIVIFIWIYSK
jgi:hypothetical protein